MDNRIALIGSRGAAIANPLMENRINKNSDYDLIMTPERLLTFKADLEKEFGDYITRWEEQHDGKVVAVDIGTDLQVFQHIDIELALPGSSALAILNTCPRESNYSELIAVHFWDYRSFRFEVVVPTLSWLAVIKRSHVHIPMRKWHRHIVNYSLMRFMLGGNDFKFTLNQIEVLRARVREHNALYGAHAPRLKDMTKDEFFGGEQVMFRTPLPPIFLHDDIHVAISKVMSDSDPAYCLMTDGKEVECTREGWNSMSHEDKVRAAIEEALVLAIERSMAPFHYLQQKRLFDDNITPERSFQWALMRICTNITSGWFRAWCVDHYFDILNTYRKSYSPTWWDKFLAEPPAFWRTPAECREWVDNLDAVETPSGKPMYPAFTEE